MARPKGWCQTGTPSVGWKDGSAQQKGVSNKFETVATPLKTSKVALDKAIKALNQLKRK